MYFFCSYWIILNSSLNILDILAIINNIKKGYKMIIDDKTINKLEKLSSLSISDERKETLKEELAEIVTFVENLNEIDVSEVEATFTTISGGQALRDDEVTSKIEVSQHILSNAPKTDDNHFIVPAIIE